MTAYIVRRVLGFFAVLFVVAVVTFIVMRLTPGSPFDREKQVPERVKMLLERKYNLDAPLHIQFLDYMGDILVPQITPRQIVQRRGEILEDYLINIDIPGTESTLRWMNFGPSYKSQSQSVNRIFIERLPPSFQLGTAATLVSLVIGVPLGTLAALNRNSWIDYTSMALALIGVSIPVIISGPVARYIFGVQLQWLPPTGWGTWQHMIMPAIALGFASSAVMARLTRASLLQVLNEDYIRTARAKGLSERVVISLHALKNAMIPVVTIIGPLFAALVTGSFVTERIFGIPGMGEFFVTSISNRDYPVIMGTTLLYAAFLVLANLLVDLTYALLDPRIRY
jgi:ABC-type dipeptide/oligopeptide/nickel transport system permease component